MVPCVQYAVILALCQGWQSMERASKERGCLRMILWLLLGIT